LNPDCWIILADPSPAFFPGPYWWQQGRYVDLPEDPADLRPLAMVIAGEVDHFVSGDKRYLLCANYEFATQRCFASRSFHCWRK
jgi:hypothetical protein